MKYYVYCAANIPENQSSIDLALKVVSSLERQWELNADVHGAYEGSQFTIIDNDGGNTSIYAEDTDISRLIYSCMCFAHDRAITTCKETNKTTI